MTEREKIIKVIDEWANKAVKANKFDGASVYNPHNAAGLADALIAAGLKFDRNISYTATLNLAQLERINYFEKRLAKAEHRAEVAERALLRARKVNTIFAEPDVPNILAESVLYEAYIRQAEKELAEGKKDKGEVKE